MKKRSYRSSSFKKKVALEAIREEKTINEIAKKYDIHPMQVSQWKSELLNNAELVFEKKKSYKDDYEKKEASLHEQIGKLTVEIDWLKKKLGV